MAKDDVPYVVQKVQKQFTVINSGLPSNKIYRLLIDKNGYLWLSSDKGLTLYNGTTFRNIITGHDFVSQYKTKEEKLWLFDYNGSTKVIDLNTHQIINSDSLYGLSKLKLNFPQKTFLAARQSGDTLELFKQISDEYVRINLKTRKSEIIKGGNINSNGYMRDFSVRKSLFDSIYFQPEMIKKQYIPYSYNNNFYFNNFLVLVENGRKYHFWGSDYHIHAAIFGAFKEKNDLIVAFFDTKIGVIRIHHFFDQAIQNQKVETILNGVSATNIAKDEYGNMWVSTYKNGLYKFEASNKGVIILHNNIIENKQISKIGFLDSEKLWVSYINNSAINTINVNKTDLTMKVKSILLPITGSIQKIELSNDFWLMCTESDNYFALWNKQKQLLKTKHIGNNKMNLSSKDLLTKNNSLFVLHTHHIQEITKEGQIKTFGFGSSTMSSFETFDQQNFYYGTVSGCYYNKQKLCYLSKETIYKVRSCNNKLIWSSSKGVFACDTHLRLQKPILLASEICKNIESDDNFLYLYNEIKILVFDKRKLIKIREINLQKFALQSYLIDITINSKYIVAATDNGLVYFPKKDFTNTYQRIPKIHIINSLYSNRPNDSFYEYRYDKKITANFDIEFIDYNNLDKIVLNRVLKEGQQYQEWTNTEGKTQIKLNAPKPGKYEVQYKIISPEQGWEVSKSYTLIVQPAWYQSNWFYGAMIMIALGIIALLIYVTQKYYNNKSRLIIEEESKIFSIKSKSILAQLKPHFIFNSITPLQSYFINNDKRGGLEYINQYSQLMRNLLNNIREEEISVAKEVKFLTQYINIQQKRFSQLFTYSITINDGVEDAKIPSMMLQPLIENAIEHGFELRSTKNQILTIVFELKNNNLHIFIEDNGVGMPKEFNAKDNHALAIIQEQIGFVAKKYGIGSLNIYKPQNNQGTGIEIELPYIL